MAAAANPFTSTPSKPNPFHRLSALPDYLNPFDDPIPPPHELLHDNRFAPNSPSDSRNPFSQCSPPDSLNPFLGSSPVRSPEFGRRGSVSDDANMSLEMTTLSEEEVDPCQVFPHDWDVRSHYNPRPLSPHGIVTCRPFL